MIVITLVFCALLFMAGLNYKLVVGVLIVCIPVGLIGMTLIIQDKIPFIHAYQLGRIMAWPVSYTHLEQIRTELTGSAPTPFASMTEEYQDYFCLLYTSRCV